MRCSFPAVSCSARGRTRTCDPRLRRPSLYPAELRGRGAPEYLSHSRASRRPSRRIAHRDSAFGPPKLPIFGAALICAQDRADLHDVIWLIVLSTALIMLWGSSEHWSLAGLRRRVGHALHLDHRADAGDRRH